MPDISRKEVVGRLLALVPARGGSKRLPGKNIRPLGGRPLLAWTIDAARESGVVCDVLLSTDDEAIAAVGRAHGALVPWLRPAALATDSASSSDVAIHALDWYEAERGKVDGLILLQPTSPFRSPESIREAAHQFLDSGRVALVSLSPVSAHPAWCFRIAGERIEPFLGWDILERRSQELEPAYVLNGSIYILTPEQLRLTGSFVRPQTQPFVMREPTAAVDIDTAQDWEAAQAIVAREQS